MSILYRVSAVGVVALFAALPVSAHHPYVTKYDNSKTVRASGTISFVNYSNPHIFFTLDTGKGSWRVETESHSVAQSRGLTQSVLKEGAKAAVTGWPDRDGTGELGLKTISFQGGPTITMRNTAR